MWPMSLGRWKTMQLDILRRLREDKVSIDEAQKKTWETIAGTSFWDWLPAEFEKITHLF